MNFRVGQKVVCVDDGFPGCVPDRELIRVNETYTVSWVGHFDHPRPERFHGISVHLREIRRKVSDFGFIMPYRATRFRPLVERKTSIEIFTRMLLPVKEDA